MDFLYTDYAEETIRDRKISKKIVENAILNPDEIIEGKKGRKVSHKLTGDKLLRVVFEQEAKVYIIITAYYTNPKRYLKK